MGSFPITSSYALRDTPQFLRQMKGFRKIYNRGRFRLYRICVCEVINLEMLSWRWSSPGMVHFFSFWGEGRGAPNSPKYDPILLKFALELVFKKSKTWLENFFKISNFYGNWTYSKFTGFFQFLSNFDPLFLHEESRNGYPNIAKSRPYLVPISKQKYDYFCPILTIFCQKRGMVQG